MISRFFIDRPIFATVLSIVITLIGGISLLFLPIAQYPRITPPGVSISLSYPGASAQVVADTVGAPIEQQVNGVEGMLYMSSTSGNDGTYSLSVTFDIGTDLNAAVVKVQNRVALAMPQLPSQVQNQGITVRKKTPDILMIVNFFSNRRVRTARTSTTASTSATTPRSTSATSCCGCPGCRTSRIKASATTASAAGSIRRRWRPATLRPATLPARYATRTWMRRPAGSARRLLFPHPGLRITHRHAGPAEDAGAVRRHHRQGRPEPPPPSPRTACAPPQGNFGLPSAAVLLCSVRRARPAAARPAVPRRAPPR